MAGSTERDLGERLFLSELALIERVIRNVCARCRFTGPDVEEFASWSKLRLIQDDYAALRAFKNQSQFGTYLTVVVRRHLVDYQAATWGRWRPSATARRGGPILMDLERLVVRDGRTLDEAARLLCDADGRPVPPQQVEALAASLPPRQRRRFEGDEALHGLPSREPPPDAGVAASERRRALETLRTRLQAALEGLDVQDRLILQLKFEDGHRVADIAVLLRLDQKKLYRRIDGLLRRLRLQLDADGVASDVLDRVLSDDGEWPAYADDVDGSGGTLTARPSIPQGVTRGAP
jgi:RNA polymerase sigma factor (sigma-70 family)